MLCVFFNQSKINFHCGKLHKLDETCENLNTVYIIFAILNIFTKLFSIIESNKNCGSRFIYISTDQGSDK